MDEIDGLKEDYEKLWGQLLGEIGAPMPAQSNIDGAKFVSFIDTVVEDAYRSSKYKK